MINYDPTTINTEAFSHDKAPPGGHTVACVTLVDTHGGVATVWLTIRQNARGRLFADLDVSQPLSGSGRKSVAIHPRLDRP